jgi:hypothetical protein
MLRWCGSRVRRGRALRWWRGSMLWRCGSRVRRGRAMRRWRRSMLWRRGSRVRRGRAMRRWHPGAGRRSGRAASQASAAVGDRAAVRAGQRYAPVGLGVSGHSRGKLAAVVGDQRAEPGYLAGCVQQPEPGAQRHGQVDRARHGRDARPAGIRRAAGPVSGRGGAGGASRPATNDWRVGRTRVTGHARLVRGTWLARHTRSAWRIRVTRFSGLAGYTWLARHTPPTPHIPVIGLARHSRPTGHIRVTWLNGLAGHSRVC